MLIPDRVKIGALWFEVVRAAIPDPDRREVLGCIRYADATIRIPPDLGEQQGDVFFHELMHGAVDFVAMTAEIDERAVERLSNALYMILTDNGLLAPAASGAEREGEGHAG
jgi:hypothetical protein